MTEEICEKRVRRATQRIAILERMLEEKTRELFLEKERLKETYEYLNNILRTGMMGIIATDASGVIAFANKAAAQTFGGNVEDLLGRVIFELFPVSVFGDDPVGDGLEAVDGFQDEVVITGADGATVLNLSLSLIRDETENASGIVCMLQDVSEKKRLERKVLQGEKLEAVGQLAAGVAHEINTPIQYIRDNLQFLETEFPLLSTALESYVSTQTSSSAPVDAALESIRYLIQEIPLAVSQSLKGAESVAQIVRSLKQFSHPGSAERDYVDINACLDSVLIVSRNEWKYVAEVERDLDPSLPRILGFQSDINQAFLNLVVNAGHAISERKSREPQAPGTIFVRTSCEGAHVVIEIRDTGTGIDQSISQRVFDPFFTTKPVGKGTGQGLALVYSTIVSKHGGQIDFSSTVGEGTSFFVRFPLPSVDRRDGASTASTGSARV